MWNASSWTLQTKKVNWVKPLNFTNYQSGQSWSMWIIASHNVIYAASNLLVSYVFLAELELAENIYP